MTIVNGLLACAPTTGMPSWRGASALTRSPNVPYASYPQFKYNNKVRNWKMIDAEPQIRRKRSKYGRAAENVIADDFPIGIVRWLTQSQVSQVSYSISNMLNAIERLSHLNLEPSQSWATAISRSERQQQDYWGHTTGLEHGTTSYWVWVYLNLNAPSRGWSDWGWILLCRSSCSVAGLFEGNPSSLQEPTSDGRLTFG